MLKKAQVFDVKTLDVTFNKISFSTYMFHLNAKWKEREERKTQASSCNEILEKWVAVPPN